MVPYRPAAVQWIAGKQAVEMESLTQEQLENDIELLLKLFPEVKVPRAACEKPYVYATRWGSNPRFLGSYTYVKTGGTPDAIDEMAKPLTVKDA